MDWLEILKYIAAIASGLAAAIPLVIQLVKYIKQAVKEKNWGVVLEKVMKLMETAETKFKDGAERKEWVLAMLKASADGINYDIDYDAIADMIDSLCDMSNVINPATPANKVNVYTLYMNLVRLHTYRLQNYLVLYLKLIFWHQQALFGHQNQSTHS